MEAQKGFNIFVGLKDKTMTKTFDKVEVIKAFANKLKNIGVLGFNVSEQKGFWKGNPEDSLKFSFINTFGVSETDLKYCIKTLKNDFEQDSILIENYLTECSFV